MNILRNIATAALQSTGVTFPFQIGDRLSLGPVNAPAFETSVIWDVRTGVKKDDGQPLTLFVFDLAQQQTGKDGKALFQLARNALKKLRTIRHPNMYVAGSVYSSRKPSTDMVCQPQVYRFRRNGYTDLYRHRTRDSARRRTAAMARRQDRQGRRCLPEKGPGRVDRMGSTEYRGKSDALTFINSADLSPGLDGTGIPERPATITTPFPPPSHIGIHHARPGMATRRVRAPKWERGSAGGRVGRRVGCRSRAGRSGRENRARGPQGWVGGSERVSLSDAVRGMDINGDWRAAGPIRP